MTIKKLKLFLGWRSFSSLNDEKGGDRVNWGWGGELGVRGWIGGEGVNWGWGGESGGYLSVWGGEYQLRCRPSPHEWFVALARASRSIIRFCIVVSISPALDLRLRSFTEMAVTPSGLAGSTIDSRPLSPARAPKVSTLMAEVIPRTQTDKHNKCLWTPIGKIEELSVSIQLSHKPFQFSDPFKFFIIIIIITRHFI